MALPKGWTETRNEWRVRLRDPQLFARIRPKRLEGIGGVYIVGGPIRGQGSSFVPQAVRFHKSEWPSLTAAVGWFEASRFSSGRIHENPHEGRSSYIGGHTAIGIKIPSPYSSKASIRWSDGSLGRVSMGKAIELVGTSRVQDALDRPGQWIVLGQLRRENPGIVDAIRPGDRVTIVDRFGQRHTGRAVMRSSHGGWVLNMGGKHGTPGIADESNIVKVSPRKNPPLENPPPDLAGVRVERYGRKWIVVGVRRDGTTFFYVTTPTSRREAQMIAENVRERFGLPATERERRKAAGERIERKTVHADYWIESSTAEELAADPGSPYRMVTTGGQRFGLSVLDAIRAQRQQGLEYRGRGTPPPLENPHESGPALPFRHTGPGRVTLSKEGIRAFKARWPVSGLPDKAVSFEFDPNGDLRGTRPSNALMDAFGSGAAGALISDALQFLRSREGPEPSEPVRYRRGAERERILREMSGWPKRRNPPSRRLEAFKSAAEEQVARVVKTQTEISALFAQAFELADRGEKVPEWIRERARALELERQVQLEALRTAVARHAAAVGEFSTPRRRANPAAARRDAVRMFKSFHGGRPPTGYRFQRVPDLSQLVTLGRVLSIDYQLEPHVARGSQNTPYRHAFGPGSTLLTDPTGRVLVVVGNLKVSRSPRGRFGYIRTASEG